MGKIVELLAIIGLLALITTGVWLFLTAVSGG